MYDLRNRKISRLWILVPWALVFCIFFIPQIFLRPIPFLAIDVLVIIIVGLPAGLGYILSLPESQDAILLKLFWMIVASLHIVFMVNRRFTIWAIIFLIMTISAVGCRMMPPPTATQLSVTE